MTERSDYEASADSDSTLEGPAAPPAKGGGQEVEDLDAELDTDTSSSSLEGLDGGDEGASPPPPRGGGG